MELTMGSNPIVFDGNILGLQKFGGVSAYLARIASEVFAAGFSVSITQPKNLTYHGPFRDEVSRIPVSAVDCFPARLSQYCRASGVQANSVFHSAYYRRPDRAVSNYVITVHDFTYELHRTGAARLLHSRLKTLAIRDADTVICISERTRRDVLNYVPEVSPNKLVVIPHGIDHGSFYHDISLQLAQMDQTVLFVGQRSPYKRFDLAVDALAALRDLRLGVVGPALNSSEVLNLNSQIPGRWTYFGQVSNDELRRLYSTAFAFIFPSDYEGFGLPMLEAMACGCPVVASSCGALPEVGGEAAIYTESQSSDAYVEKLSSLTDHTFRNALIRKGLTAVSTKSWRTSIIAHLDVYGVSIS